MKPCKLILQGISLKPNKILMPCNQFKPNSEWASSFSISQISSLEEYKSHKLVQQLHDDLNNGIEDPQCQRCWSVEANGSNSWRQINDDQLDDDSFRVVISMGSACNLKCVMCIPQASSKIEAEYKKIYKKTLDPFYMFDGSKTKADKEFNDWIKDLASRASHLTIIGGEPFYIKAFPKVLNLAKENNVKEVDMFTNGTMIDFDLLQGLNHILINFSIDAVEEEAEYVRSGCVWDEVKNNYLQCLTLPNVTSHVNPVFTMFNIFGVPKLGEFFKDHYPKHFHISLADPDHFNAIENLPPDLLDEAKQCFEQFLKHLLSNKDIDQWERVYLEDAVANAISRLGTRHTQAKFEQFINHTKTLDSVRKENITQYFPQFKKYYGV